MSISRIPYSTWKELNIRFGKSGVIMLCSYAGKRWVLLILSAKTGYLDIPGGKVEYGELVHASAKREVYEETCGSIDLPVYAFDKSWVVFSSHTGYFVIDIGEVDIIDLIDKHARKYAYSTTSHSYDTHASMWEATMMVPVLLDVYHSIEQSGGSAGTFMKYYASSVAIPDVVRDKLWSVYQITTATYPCIRDTEKAYLDMVIDDK